MTQHPRHVTVPAARGEQETWLCEDDLEGVHVQTLATAILGEVERWVSVDSALPHCVLERRRLTPL